MIKCQFCGTKHLEVNKYKCAGINNNKKTTKTIKICICCDAQTDNDWLAEQLGWDEVKAIIVED